MKERRLGLVDYLLAGTASCLAAFSAGSGLNTPDVSTFFILLTLVATAVGFVLQKILPPKIAAADGFLYATFAILALFNMGPLNNIVPGEGFPETLRIAGWLCWMLVFGSLFMWRDSTVLFQAVPGIAVFGYVGTWDTFRAAPFLFFGFLLCFATLFARAHGRDMMDKARESGFTPTSLDVNRPGGFLRALRAGPWRWMAGPEWAMLSALLVVMISVVGGPFLQFSLQGVAGSVKLPPPPTGAMRQHYFGQTPGASNSFYTRPGDAIGTGPHHELLGKPIFKARMPESAYLRMHTFLGYNMRGWEEVTSVASINETAREEFEVNTHPSDRMISFPFDLRCIDGSYDSIPVPGNIASLNEIASSRFRVDGTIPNDSSIFGPNAHIEGLSTVSAETSDTADRENPALKSYSSFARLQVTPRVRQFAMDVVKGSKTDMEKARAIQAAISGRCVYDLKAPGVPSGQDPVEYFLFVSKRGYCDLFGSAMTVMARSVGLPARYTIGFAPFTDPTVHDGAFTFYDTDYHAWCDIYFQKAGWTIFDATDGAAMAPDAGRGARTDSTPWYKLPTFQLSFATLAVVVAGWGIFQLGKKYRVRLFPARNGLSTLEKGYADLVRTVESKTGKPRRPSQTPYEYLEAVRPYLDGSFGAFSSATDAFVATFYSASEPNEEQVESFKKLVDDARAALKPIKRPKDPPSDSHEG